MFFSIKKKVSSSKFFLDFSKNFVTSLRLFFDFLIYFNEAKFRVLPLKEKFPKPTFFWRQFCDALALRLTPRICSICIGPFFPPLFLILFSRRAACRIESVSRANILSMCSLPPPVQNTLFSPRIPKNHSSFGCSAAVRLSASHHRITRYVTCTRTSGLVFYA